MSLQSTRQHGDHTASITDGLRFTRGPSHVGSEVRVNFQVADNERAIFAEKRLAEVQERQ